MGLPGDPLVESPHTGSGGHRRDSGSVRGTPFVERKTTLRPRPSYSQTSVALRSIGVTTFSLVEDPLCPVTLSPTRIRSGRTRVDLGLYGVRSGGGPGTPCPRLCKRENDFAQFRPRESGRRWFVSLGGGGLPGLPGEGLRLDRKDPGTLSLLQRVP